MFVISNIDNVSTLIILMKFQIISFLGYYLIDELS